MVVASISFIQTTKKKTAAEKEDTKQLQSRETRAEKKESFQNVFVSFKIFLVKKYDERIACKWNAMHAIDHIIIKFNIFGKSIIIAVYFAYSL